ncbi:hypothetical protein LCM10_06280 [Rossellomorea aquimaris]|uniref:hypothetical protein n=1 Tax=Rossellomorea aquimaris TaxID=189382 RepID=UPI001CD50884|nr:hypothetical protein [Rossellomorea aquimaris]MCA1054588.1 hypothetical protein [Rossellomorea aquimaris]
MEHSLRDFHKIYQALEGSLSSISIDQEADASIQHSLMDAKINLNKAFQYELQRHSRRFD